jgi:hypothetical protein
VSVVAGRGLGGVPVAGTLDVVVDVETAAVAMVVTGVGAEARLVGLGVRGRR